MTYLSPRKSLNKAFLKVKPNRHDIDSFKENLAALLTQTNTKIDESEEFHKNNLTSFFKKTYYGSNYYINTKDKHDLVIHNGKKIDSSVGVILETKSPTNEAEMLKINHLNTKAFQQLIFYYLQERIQVKNLEIKYLIVTNIHQWFIFDASLLDKLFVQNKSLVENFTNFLDKRLSIKTRDLFYQEVTKPAIDKVKDELSFTYFNLLDYQEILLNYSSKNKQAQPRKEDDKKLISLYKLLSPQHLLKLPFINDSNSLDKGFYSELLHIIGLTEVKKGSKKLIQRQKEGQRNSGSLLENAIIQLDTLDKISRLKKVYQFGENYQEQLFNVSLELVITWIIRSSIN